MAVNCTISPILRIASGGVITITGLRVTVTCASAVSVSAVAVTVPVMGTSVSVVAVNSPPGVISPIFSVVVHTTSASTTSLPNSS